MAMRPYSASRYSILTRLGLLLGRGLGVPAPVFRTGAGAAIHPLSVRFREIRLPGEARAEAFDVAPDLGLATIPR